MKELKYYLWKLKYLEGVKVSKKDFDKKNLPNDIYYSEWSGKYTKIDCNELNSDDIDIFIKVKNAYNFNIIRICVVICTVFFILLTLSFL